MSDLSKAFINAQLVGLLQGTTGIFFARVRSNDGVEMEIPISAEQFHTWKLKDQTVKITLEIE